MPSQASRRHTAFNFRTPATSCGKDGYIFKFVSRPQRVIEKAAWWNSASFLDWNSDSDAFRKQRAPHPTPTARGGWRGRGRGIYPQADRRFFPTRAWIHRGSGSTDQWRSGPLGLDCTDVHVSLSQNCQVPTLQGPTWPKERALLEARFEAGDTHVFCVKI